jgi:hypothetical protein
MRTGLRGRDLITCQEWTKGEIDSVLDVALDLKRRRAMGQPHALLEDKVLAMLFFFSSTRTRASFEAGMAQLGGHAQFIESKTTQIAHGDTAKEIGEILGRYNDGIAIRHVDWKVGNGYLRDVAAASRVPVLNMQATCITHSTGATFTSWRRRRSAIHHRRPTLGRPIRLRGADQPPPAHAYGANASTARLSSAHQSSDQAAENAAPATSEVLDSPGAPWR